MLLVKLQTDFTNNTNYLLMISVITVHNKYLHGCYVFFYDYYNINFKVLTISSKCISSELGDLSTCWLDFFLVVTEYTFSIHTWLKSDHTDRLQTWSG